MIPAAVKNRACQPQPPTTVDALLHEQLLALPPAEIARARELASSIQDPVIRAGAVTGWVRQHRAELPRQQALDLCAQLEEPAAGLCSRYVELAHLSR